jgi:hypothetical protein
MHCLRETVLTWRRAEGRMVYILDIMVCWKCCELW